MFQGSAYATGWFLIYEKKALFAPPSVYLMEKYNKLRLIYPFLAHVGGYKGDADFSLIDVSPLTLCKLKHIIGFFSGFIPSVSCWMLLMGR